MKKLTALMVAGMPATALAHPGHAELAGPQGHDFAHLLIAGGIASAVVIAATVVRKVVAQTREG